VLMGVPLSNENPQTKTDHPFYIALIVNSQASALQIPSLVICCGDESLPHPAW
jgi:hypothetical protein